MPTAFSGSLGWTGLHPMQLGGPPLINTYARTIPSQARGLIAHVYQNDGVSFLGSFPPLNLPTLSSITTNGGMEQIQLETATRTFTGFTITQGNVIRLTFQGGDGSVVYSGVVEDLPDIATPTKTTHLILLSPFGFELDDVHSTSFYNSITDIAKVIRDAVAQTRHCSCDQTSVPATTGIQAPATIGGSLDFRNQTLKQQIDTCRSIAGPTWYWYCDELGRVWFQSMGSSAVYTMMRGPHYQERTSAATIQNRKNHIVVVGGVPVGGSVNVVGTYDGVSQSTIGIRGLFPALQAPNLTDQASVTSIATNIGAVLDRIWNRVNVKLHPSFAQRVHGSQPGGGMMRYWEPTVSPIGQSEAGSGTYSGPYITQRVEYDGLNQVVIAGDIPVTSETDVNNMVNSFVQREAANSVQVTAAALNLSQQVITGTFQSGTTSVTGAQLPAALWRLDQQMFQAFDPSGVARFQAGNLTQNGVSPAQWGARINAADGTPLFDGVGAVGLPKKLAEVIQTSAVQGSNTSFADVSGGVTPTFTLSRQSNVLVMGMGRFAAEAIGSGNIVFLALRCGSDVSTGAPMEVDAQAARNFVPFSLFLWDTLAAGSYTAALQAQTSLSGGGNQWDVAYLDVVVFQFGG